jgi:hypothetical protein
MEPLGRPVATQSLMRKSQGSPGASPITTGNNTMPPVLISHITACSVMVGRWMGWMAITT